jgi:hypothetical protein
MRRAIPAANPQYSPAAPGLTGDAQDLAVALGARFGERNAINIFWAPVSVRTRAVGTTAVFPHFVMDRSKPGTVCVKAGGASSTSRNPIMNSSALETNPTAPCALAFIVTDVEGLRKYGLGMIRPEGAD